MRRRGHWHARSCLLRVHCKSSIKDACPPSVAVRPLSAAMSAAKNLVTYSDEEEDANYDDVGMDMSDDEGGDNDKEAAKDSS